MKGSTEQFTVFEHEEAGALFRDLLARFPGRKRALSGSQLARELGYASPRSIELVVQGARPPSRAMIARLSDRLKLSAKETQYLELLAQKKSLEKKGRPAQAVVLKLASLRGTSYRKRPLETADFKHVSEWYHAPIQQLVACPGFREDPKWIAAKLSNAITPAQARQAIARLLENRILIRDAKTGRLAYPDFEYVEASSPGAPSSAIRAHHRQMLARMADALDSRPMAERKAFNLCLRFDPSRLEEAQRSIEAFCAEFNRQFPPGETDQVYQLGAYLFPHTEKST